VWRGEENGVQIGVANGVVLETSPVCHTSEAARASGSRQVCIAAPLYASAKKQARIRRNAGDARLPPVQAGVLQNNSGSASRARDSAQLRAIETSGRQARHQDTAR